MVGKVWSALICASCVCAVMTGRGALSAQTLMDSGKQAVELLAELLGAMTLWSGLMEQLDAAGDLKRLGRLIRRGAQKLFPGIENEEAWSAAGMNLAANLLGLGNAATPAGIRAAELLSRQGEAGLKALGALLVLNNSGLQLMPATVIALRSAAGSADPAGIWLPTLLSSGAATLTAVLLLTLRYGRSKRSCKER